MPSRRNNRYLYLAIACFLGLVAVFIFAGYMGLYETVFIRTGEYEQKIDPQFWRDRNITYPYTIGAAWGDTVSFRYEINNRRFSSYAATVDISLWQSNQKVLNLLRSDVSLAGFERTTLEWSVTPDALAGAGLQVGQYTVKISRDGSELGQGIIIGYNTAGYPPKVVPAVPPAVRTG